MGPAGAARGAVPVPGGRADAGPGRFPCQGKRNGRGTASPQVFGRAPGLLLPSVSIHLSIYRYCSTAWAMRPRPEAPSSAGTRSTPRNSSRPLGTAPRTPRWRTCRRAAPRGREFTWLQHTATSHALSLSKSLRPTGQDAPELLVVALGLRLLVGLHGVAVEDRAPLRPRPGTTAPSRPSRRTRRRGRRAGQGRRPGRPRASPARTPSRPAMPPCPPPTPSPSSGRAAASWPGSAGSARRSSWTRGPPPVALHGACARARRAAAPRVGVLAPGPVHARPSRRPRASSSAGA